MLLKCKLSIMGMFCVELQEFNSNMSLDVEESLDQGARKLPRIFASSLFCFLSLFFFNFSFLGAVLHGTHLKCI